jgi:glycosyltransferase involved in cell wall biosynthesis
MNNNKVKTVSVVIPCFNEQNYIETCVKSLLTNGFPVADLEILVIDGESTDKTVSILNDIKKDFPQVKHINNPKKKTPFALNLGIENAQNNYILIASAHSSFDKGYIQELINKIQELNVDVVGGVMETRVKNLTTTSQAIKQVLANKFGVGNAMFRIGVNEPTLVDTVPFGLYKTTLLKSVGGYDENLIRNHDIELSKRLLKLGAKIYLVPTTKCYYYARETYKELSQNNYRNGKWNLLTVFLTKDFTSLSIRHFVPLLFVLSLLIPLVLSVLFFPIAYFAFIVLLLYFLAVGLIVLKTFDLSKTTFLKGVWSFSVLHFSYGFGSLIGMFNFYKLF